MQRAKLLAARALAAYPGYASTRKVQTPEKTKNMLLVVRNCGSSAKEGDPYPAPKKTLPMMGTIQWTER